MPPIPVAPGSRSDDILTPPPRKDHSHNPTVNWCKEKRSNQTRQSVTDPFAQPFKKQRGGAARLGYLGHMPAATARLDRRYPLTQATGTAEREAAGDMPSQKPARRVSRAATRPAVP